MKIVAPATELAQGYEALRAQALGGLPPLSPRGLAVFLRGGLAGWMCACPPRSRPRLAADAAAGAHEAHEPSAGSAELVRVLAQMALTRQRKCPA